MDSNNVLMAVMAIFAFLAIFAPVVLGASTSRRGPMVLAFVLTLSALGLTTVAKGFGDTVMTAALWLGALICGLAAYLDHAIRAAARTLAWRLLKLDDAGLKPPRHDQ